LGEEFVVRVFKGGKVTEGLLNKIEMAFRAYDPCLGCATHSLPGHLPLSVKIYDRNKQLVQEIGREDLLHPPRRMRRRAAGAAPHLLDGRPALLPHLRRSDLHPDRRRPEGDCDSHCLEQGDHPEYQAILQQVFGFLHYCHKILAAVRYRHYRKTATI
jgi:hypothetical protein